MVIKAYTKEILKENHQKIIVITIKIYSTIQNNKEI